MDFGGKIKLIPQEKQEENPYSRNGSEIQELPFEGSGNTFSGYELEIPEVTLEQRGEEYYPQTSFSWMDDSVELKRKNETIVYTKSYFQELYAIDENGNKVWIDGRNAPYSGCWNGKYLDKDRSVEEYTVTEYDVKTLQKTTYKMQKNKTEPMNDYEIGKYVDIKKCDKAMSDEKVLIDAVSHDAKNYKDIPEELKNDVAFNKKLIGKLWDLSFIQYTNPEIKENNDFIKTALEKDGSVLEFLLDDIKNNKELALIAVSSNAKAYQFISDKLKKDKEIVMLVAEDRSGSLKDLDKSVLTDKELVLQLMKVNSDVFEFVDNSIKDDKVVVMTGLMYTSYNATAYNHFLRFASDRLKDDEEVIKKAVFINGELLRYASNRLKENKEIAMLAIANSVESLRYVPQILFKDKEVIDFVLSKGFSAIGLIENKEVIVSLLKKDKSLYKFVSCMLKNDNDIRKAAGLPENKEDDFSIAW